MSTLISNDFFNTAFFMNGTYMDINRRLPIISEIFFFPKFGGASITAVVFNHDQQY